MEGQKLDSGGSQPLGLLEERLPGGFLPAAGGRGREGVGFAHEPVSPVALSSEEQTRIVRAAVTAGWTTVEEIQRVLTLRKRRQKKARARRQAGGGSVI